MAVRPIVLYPNPILREKARHADPASEEVRRALQDLWDTLDDHTGVGLAAPQIGRPLRMIVVDATRARHPVSNHGRVALLNPRLLTAEGRISVREGCLSIPDLVAHVPRAERVTVAGTLPDGRPATLAPEGFEAVIFQHEIDHLDGVLFIDRVRRARDLKARPK
ncbi:MAG: peptide deformylase [Candidatus Sumerlaeota bacterium]|nr:peptide deformylase [Candidatus Sumerlaeota bacterium]